MMIASNVTGMNVAPSNLFDLTQVAPEVIEVRQTLPNQNKKIVIQKNMTVEEYVRNYFSDIPVMIEIARCESRFRQHDINGGVLRGEENSADLGVMQINEFYHDTNSEKLGYDIMTLEGNTAYGRHLFEQFGVKPWNSSRPCWGQSVAYSQYAGLAVK